MFKYVTYEHFRIMNILPLGKFILVSWEVAIMISGAFKSLRLGQDGNVPFLHAIQQEL